VSDRPLRVAIALLAAVGAGIAAYLTWVHYEPGALVCLRGSSGCERVNSSRYAELAGIPVALLGLVTYVLVLASALVRSLAAAAAASALSLAGLAFAGWLVYVQASILDAWCPWCLASDCVLALLTAACLARLLRPAP
jgi:uncharacterized membrane protein